MEMNKKEHSAWDKDEEGFYHCNKCNRALMIGGSLQDVADTSPYCGACLNKERQAGLEEGKKMFCGGEPIYECECWQQGKEEAKQEIQLKLDEDVNDVLDMHEERIATLENEIPAAWQGGFNEAYVKVQLVHEQMFKDMQTKNGMTSGKIAAAWFRDQFNKRWKELQEAKRNENNNTH
jgi:hypothetical protein